MLGIYSVTGQEASLVTDRKLFEVSAYVRTGLVRNRWLTEQGSYDIACIYFRLADYPALPGYLFIQMLYQTRKGLMVSEVTD
jgi:hypothetical protein